MILKNAFLFFVVFMLQNQTTDIKYDKDKQLNIKYDEIKEKNYQSSSEVEINKDKPIKINIKAGSSVNAKEVNMTLKNIYGQVKFKVDTKKITEKIK